MTTEQIQERLPELRERYGKLFSEAWSVEIHQTVDSVEKDGNYHVPFTSTWDPTYRNGTIWVHMGDCEELDEEQFDEGLLHEFIHGVVADIELLKKMTAKSDLDSLMFTHCEERIVCNVVEAMKRWKN